jgi:DNA helicase II / ATP-dependent DNA helicase PcrA
MISIATNPAAVAADEAQARVDACIEVGRNFRLEAGAGAGKTYSLVTALKRIIDAKGLDLLRRDQRVACITYTEVARDEIAREIEEHPAIVVNTIHAFSWAFLNRFQKTLRSEIAEMADRAEKIAEGGGVGEKRVEYSLGFFGVDEGRISLGHDDVPRLMGRLLGLPKFQRLFAQAFPIVLIDEYQDTDPNFMGALSEHFLEKGAGPLIGLFGDHWQTIYRNDFSLRQFQGVEGIDKGANFRSVPAVVNVLNALRPELPQEVSNPEAVGEARFFHANSYIGERTSTPHSKGDLPASMSRLAVSALRDKLAAEGWDFSPKKTKVLMLTHSALAAEQGYPNLAAVFDRNESFAKREDPTIEFLVGTLEPMVEAYDCKQYGEMFRVMGGSPALRSHEDKVAWREQMERISSIRSGGTVGELLDFLKSSRRPRIPDRVMKRDEDLEAALQDESLATKATSRQQLLREVRYREVIELRKFLDGYTPFATKHSVKGAQFENVLVVLGGGWNQYNWPQMFELIRTRALTPKNEKAFLRARNLFYVAISRPKMRLAVLATQTLNQEALSAAGHLFGMENVVGLDLQ